MAETTHAGVARHSRRRLGLIVLPLLGIGALSAVAPASNAALPQPTAVVAVAGNNTARVSWAAPLGIDPTAATYQVTAEPGGQTVTVPATETSTTVRFLANGTTYRFQVGVVTFDELGPLSLPSAPVTPQDVCTIVGTIGDDVLSGTPANDAICGLGGNDILKGLGGGDTFVGGPGLDTVDFADSAERVFAFLPGPSLFDTNGLGKADGQGSDLLRPDIEALSGSAYADILEGDDAPNTISGQAGNDIIRGWGGNDVISGQLGNDELWGLSEDDQLNGGDGNDLLMPRGNNDIVTGGLGADTVTFTRPVTVDLTAGTAVGLSSDVLSGVENVTGSMGNDILLGSSAANVLNGGAGHDSLSGLGASDKLYGEDGDDALTGGAGTADVCDGGLGVDTASTCETVSFVP